MKPIKNIRNTQEKPLLVKLSNEGNDRPLVNIKKGKNENSLILPSTPNPENSKKSSIFSRNIIDANTTTTNNGSMNYLESRQEIDDFFFDSNTLPDISKTSINQLTSNSNNTISTTTTTNNNNNNNNNNKKKSLSQQQHHSISSLNGKEDGVPLHPTLEKYSIKREKFEKEFDNNNNKNELESSTKSTKISSLSSNTLNTSTSISKKRNGNGVDTHSTKLDTQHPPNPKNLYEENEEWLLKNTDKLLRNLFDRQKKWEDTRTEIQQSIEKIKSENNETSEKELSEAEKQQREK